MTRFDNPAHVLLRLFDARVMCPICCEFVIYIVRMLGQEGQEHACTGSDAHVG